MLKKTLSTLAIAATMAGMSLTPVMTAQPAQAATVRTVSTSTVGIATTVPSGSTIRTASATASATVSSSTIGTARTVRVGKARLDTRCLTGARVLCIDKTARKLYYVKNGKLELTLAARFGASATPTRQGVFHVYLKDKNHVSTVYHSKMPFSMFFVGGQAVHYSSDFAARGYAGASHGCVNIRDYKGIAFIFSQVKIGDKVVVYRS